MENCALVPRIESSGTRVFRRNKSEASPKFKLGDALEDFYKENDSRCDIQEKSACAFAERKQQELIARLEKFKQAGKN